MENDTGWTIDCGEIVSFKAGKVIPLGHVQNFSIKTVGYSEAIEIYEAFKKHAYITYGPRNQYPDDPNGK